MKKITFFTSIIVFVVLITCIVTTWFCFKTFYQLQVNNLNHYNLLQPIADSSKNFEIMKDKIRSKAGMSSEKIKKADEWANSYLKEAKSAAREEQQKLYQQYNSLKVETSIHVRTEANNIRKNLPTRDDLINNYNEKIQKMKGTARQ